MRGLERDEGLLDLRGPERLREPEEKTVRVDLEPDGRAVPGREQEREDAGEHLVRAVAGADVADHALVGVLERDRPVGRDDRPVPVHPVEEPLGVPGRALVPDVVGEAPRPAERPDLLRDRVRDRDLLALPARELALGPLGRLDRDPPLLGVEHAPELALGDEDRARVDHADHERLVEGADRAPAGQVEDRDLPLVVDHREVGHQVPPGPGRGDDPRPLAPDQAVALHLRHDLVEERVRVGKRRGPREDRADLRQLDLAVLDQEGRDLVREHVGRAVRDPDGLDVAGLRPPDDHAGLEQVVEAGREDRPVARRPRAGGRRARPAGRVGRPRGASRTG